MKGLTAKQKEVLEFIKEFINANKYPPTIREVANKFKISVKGSYDHIKALEKKKYLKCHVNRSRAIEVVFDEEEESDKVTKLPILGNVAAGKPLFAAENFDGTIRVPGQFLGKGRFFVLNVKGDSMQDAGILDGDIAVINHRNPCGQQRHRRRPHQQGHHPQAVLSPKATSVLSSPTPASTTGTPRPENPESFLSIIRRYDH